MVERKVALTIRKAHRYLGLFLGIQFLFWTISGIYFSWTDIDEIHGDQFRKEKIENKEYADLISPSSMLKDDVLIRELELREIAGIPYYWVNKKKLYNANTGVYKSGITKSEALQVASMYMLDELDVKDVERIDSVGSHNEYRGRPLPAFMITYDHLENVKAYVSISDGNFQRVRHRSWRWFDFLWMTHTMDYQGRDDFNTLVLRFFSLLGLVTVLSGFVLWFVSSPTMRKIKKR